MFRRYIMSFHAVNEDVGCVKSRSCYCQARVPRRDTGARRRVKRLRDSLTPGRANPRQAERARHTEREAAGDNSRRYSKLSFSLPILKLRCYCRTFALISYTAALARRWTSALIKFTELGASNFSTFCLTPELKIGPHCWSKWSIYSSSIALCKSVII